MFGDAISNDNAPTAEVRPDGRRATHCLRFRTCCSRLRRAPRPRQLPPAVACPARRVPGPQGFDPRVTRPAPRPSLAAPHPVRYLSSPHLLLSISCPMTVERLPDLFPNPQRRRDASPLPPLLISAGRMCQGASDRPRASLVVVARHR